MGLGAVARLAAGVDIGQMAREMDAAVLGLGPASAPARAGEPAPAVDRDRLRRYATDTWNSITAMVQPSGLPADALHLDPEGGLVADPYTSPTNVAAYLWSVLGAESLGIIGADEATRRLDETEAWPGRRGGHASDHHANVPATLRRLGMRVPRAFAWRRVVR